MITTSYIPSLLTERKRPTRSKKNRGGYNDNSDIIRLDGDEDDYIPKKYKKSSHRNAAAHKRKKNYPKDNW